MIQTFENKSFKKFLPFSLAAEKMIALKGGQVKKGPGELVDDDIDMPDLSVIFFKRYYFRKHSNLIN